MLLLPFKEKYEKTQEFNDKRYRASYAKFGLLGHNGWDFGVPNGTKLYSPHSGKVTEVLFDASGYGWYVKIENDAEFSVLAHMRESSKLKVGDMVAAWDYVGLSGNTGNSTGPHLHWGYGRYPRNRDNGFNGYVDQTHWMNLQLEDTALITKLEGKILGLEKDISDIRISRDDWKSQAKACLATSKPLNSYKISELSAALAKAFAEGRW